MPDEAPVTSAILVFIRSSVPIFMRLSSAVVLFGNVVCIASFMRICVYAHFTSICWLLFQGPLGLFVQSQRRGFQIGKNGRPALFTESVDHGPLSGLPGRRKFLNLFPAFGCDRELHPIAASAAGGVHETVPLQGPKIPHEGRA